MLYELTRPILFRMDPERVHELVAGRLATAGRSKQLSKVLRARYFLEDPRLSQDVWGIRFPNPVGMAAGFDKNARLGHILPHLGFGFVEIGTVTSGPQAGNPKPRMFRLPKDNALINRLGFNNDGAETVATRLAKNGKPPVPMGVNIGKLRVVANQDAVADYLKTFERLFPFGDYFVVNVSSPNTPGLRDLQAKESLTAIMQALKRRNAELAKATSSRPRPLLVKLAPDLSRQGLAEFIEVARDERLDGIIATNTTTAREGLRTDIHEEGGLSGAPLRERATQMVRAIHDGTSGQIPIIGVGGIFSAEHAWEKLRAGASLVQLYTGFIYGGPATVSDINEGLLELLQAEGFDHIADAVGSA